MLKIIYNGQNYNYEHVGKQPYDISTEIDVIKDASLDEAFQAFITALNIAGYNVKRENILRAIEVALDEIEYQ